MFTGYIFITILKVKVLPSFDKSELMTGPLRAVSFPLVRDPIMLSAFSNYSKYVVVPSTFTIL